MPNWTCCIPNLWSTKQQTFAQGISKKEFTTSTSNKTTGVATVNTQGGLPVVRIKLVNENHSLSVLATCDTWSSIWLVDNSIVSTRPQKVFVRSRKPRITRWQMEKMPINVCALYKAQLLTTKQFYIHENLKLSDQIVVLQGLKHRHPHLENLQIRAPI